MPRSRSRSLRVEDALAVELAVAELAALLQQAIDQRRLAVIDVGDDGDVADVGAAHGRQAGRSQETGVGGPASVGNALCGVPRTANSPSILPAAAGIAEGS